MWTVPAVARSALIAIVIVFVLATVLGMAVLRSWILPDETVSLPLPINEMTATIEVWGNTHSEGRLELVVNSEQGILRKTLWEDWGPAQRSSFYRTEEGWLVVLGGGAEAVVWQRRG